MNLRTLLRFFVLPLFLLFSIAAEAQDKTVTGRVTDTAGRGISGVSVSVKGQAARGTTTSETGDFTISVPAGATSLVFSSVGYGSREQAISGNVVNVSLVGTSGNLNEIVVIGYGTRRQKDLVGSVTSITTKEFNRGQVTSPEQLIAGKVAGVQIVPGSGAPGSGATIRIRGGASLNASNDPLIVVDGVPLNSGGIAGSPNPLSLINPNDIESFNVLKDAAATAIYGSRASNGVIIITTKKGRKGKPTFNFSTQASVANNYRYVDVLTADELRDVVNKSNNNAAKALLGTASTNWQEEIYQNAFTTDNNLSAGGSIGNVPFRASLGYLNQDGILKTGNLQRTSAMLNLSPSLLKDYLRVNINLKGSISKNRFADEGAIGAALAFDPTKPVRSGNNRFGGFFEFVDPATNRPNVLAARNPVSLLENRNNQSNVKRSIGNIQFDYKFHFLPDLRANLNLGYDIAKGEGDVIVPDSVGADYARGGRRNQYRQDREDKLLEAYLNYSKDLKGLDSRLEIVGGYSYQDFLTTNYNFSDFNFAGTKVNPDPVFPNDKPQYTLLSYYGRLFFNLKSKYLIQASLRRDASSRFSERNRWGTFPAVALAWRLKDESFLKNSKTFNDLKLRLSYGVTGQQEGIGLYDYIPFYGLSSNTAQYQLGNTFFSMYRPQGYVDRKWEQTATYNAGLDFGFLNGRLSGTLDVYLKKTTDLLNEIAQPAGTNFSNRAIANVGSMENRGVELNLNASPVKSRNFNWDLNFNITYNKNEITKLTAVPDPNNPGVQFGGVAGGINNLILIHSVGFPRGSFYTYQQVYDEAGRPVQGLYVDRNNDGQITTADLYRFKNPDPQFFGGFSSNFSRGNWNAGFTARYSIGNYLYNNVNSNLGTFRSIYNLANILGNASRDYLNTGFTNNQVLSDYYLENASFLRLDNLFVGYNFGRVLNQKASLGVNAAVQNLFTVTKYNGVDPEISGGIDNTFYPRPRVFSLGLNLNF